MRKISEYFLILIIAVSCFEMKAQNIKKHKWKKRIVLVISKTVENANLSEQGNLFRNQASEFRNRKLIVYQVLPELYRLNEPEDNPWNNSKELYKSYNREKSDFKVVLIGLDGRVKLETSEILTLSKLYETIDAMPMRQSEIRNKN